MRSLPRGARAPRRRWICASSASGSGLGRRHRIRAIASRRTRTSERSRTASSARLSSQHVDPRLAEDAEPRPSVCCADQLLRRCAGARPRAWRTRADLVARRGDADVRIEAAAEAVTRSTGTGAVLPGIGGAQRLDAALHGFGQRRIAAGPGSSRTRRAALYGHRRGGRRPAPEILRVGERLADQRRADRPCRRGRSGCRRPVGKDDLRDAGHEQRVDDAGERRVSVRTARGRGGRVRGISLFMFLQTRRDGRESSRSISLDADERHDESARGRRSSRLRRSSADAPIRPVAHAFQRQRDQERRSRSR